MNIQSQTIHLEQLAGIQKLIQQIFDDNKISLEEILSKQVQIESSSILNLYQLVTYQWQKKQKAIEELATLFWSLEDQKRKNDEYQRGLKAQKQIKNCQETILQKQKTILELSEEIQGLKSFCEGLQARLDSAQSKLFHQGEQATKECIACEEYEVLLELLKKEHTQERDNYQAERQQQFIQLKKEQRSLQRKIQELLDENKFNKVELQLAELAVKEALSFRDASFSNRSEQLEKSDEIITVKSSGQFLNGELECFSHIQEPSYQHPTHSASQLIQSNINYFPSQSGKHQEQSFQLKLSSNEDETTLPNPFRKKNGREVRRYNTQILNNDLSDSFQSDTNTKQTLTKVERDKKTVALQCSLLKNVPRIIMLPRRKSIRKQQYQSRNMIKSQVQTGDKKSQKLQMRKQKISMTKSMISLSSNPESIGQNSLNKLFTFLSSKIITNRIKTK